MPLDLTPLARADLGETTWLSDQLGGYTGTVGDLVPATYDAYVRILHPPVDGPPMTWARVAQMRGTTLHATAAWRHLATEDDPEPDCFLDQATLPLVVDVLGRHTDTPGCCYLALWHGFGSGPRSWETASTFSLPHREYWLFEVPLELVVAASVEFRHAGALDPGPGPARLLRAGRRWWPRRPGARPSDEIDALRRAALAHRATGSLYSPTLWWPADHAWVVASEIDLDSTVVGCSRAAADGLLAAPGLETFELEATTSLMDDGTLTNPPRPC